MSGIDLEFVQTDDLIEELIKRFEYASFCGWASDTAVMRWKGEPHSLVGILQHTQWVIIGRLEASGENSIEFGG